MPGAGKKYREAESLLEDGREYAPSDALGLVRELAFADFDETVEASVRLNVDPRQADQVVRGTVVLPAGTGKEVRVVALTRGQKATEAEEAGADFAGPEYVDEIEDGWLDFDVVVATPDMMGEVGKLGPILGPRGLMPTPKAGTVTDDVARAVEEAKAGKIEFRVDRTGNVHAPVGKVSFPVEELEENFGALMDEILQQRPASAKAPYVRTVAVSSTMGPAVPVDAARYRRA